MAAVALLFLLPVIVLGQVKEGQEDKISNDNPARPLQMPPASTEAKEAIDDFDRFQRRGAWERALKSLYTIAEDQTRRFVDGENGFIIPIERKRRLILAALPANGRAACRLFYDSEAKRLLTEAEGSNELKNLETIYSSYFITSVGDNAADRLGDLYFEMGRFDRAAECWLAVVREAPDTDLSPAQLSTKAALALYRAGRLAEYEQLKSEIAERHADEKITLGGLSASPVEQLRRLIVENPTEAKTKAASAASRGEVGFEGEVETIWQARIADSIEAGMSPPELSQWEMNPLSAAVPAVAISETNLFVNFLGHNFAIDLKTGKMLWRSASFHHLEMVGMQDQSRMVDTTRFAVIASGEYVWSLAKDLKDPNFFGPFRLTCRRADNGEAVWQTNELADYAPYDLVGPPLLVGGKLYITAKSQANPQMMQGQPQQFVLAIQPEDGRLIWKVEVATFRQGVPMYYFYYNRDPSPQPRLVHRAGALYVDTQAGILAKLDAETGVLDWGYGYKTDPAQSMDRFFFGYSRPSEATSSGSNPIVDGEAFLIKGMQSDRLYALEPNRMKVLWERPISKSARLLGTDETTLFLGGPELSALDLKTRELLWATKLPSGSLDGHLLVRPDGLWQLTPRGVFEIDPKTGAVRRIFRGKDLGAASGSLYLTDRLVLAISNRAISAYPRKAAGAEANASVDAPTREKRASNEE
ncbi:PQQ-binding-like beta-propeller repeat protein [Singulisphaera sp. PoT]|uniref:outer membrane protein assembly factor BamB family protein n=1 Tax=Singulisphaera sp. PoT TaxID=3411797 RepID=UPI003BF61ECB